MAPDASRASCAEARCPSPRVGNAANATLLRAVASSRFGSQRQSCDLSFRRLTSAEPAGVRGLRRPCFERRVRRESTARTQREHSENTARTLQEHCKNTARTLRSRTEEHEQQSTARRQRPCEKEISHDRRREIRHDIRHDIPNRSCRSPYLHQLPRSAARAPTDRTQPLPREPCPRAAPSPTVIASSPRRTFCP